MPIEPPSTQTTQSLHHYPEISTLTHKFANLFQTPTTLPPPRTTNHAINLLPNSEPVNVQSYHYPYFQKQEIENQVESMLQNGIIRPSTIPFLSNVLLVKKHNRSWRFCVDYRTLNVIMVKDHFLILTMDELLDELDEVWWFS